MASAAQLQQAVSAASRELESAEYSYTSQLAAATALVDAKRGQLAAAQRALREAEELVLAPLFPELASLVFALLPVDSRLRCREMCRGWRAFLADVRFWQVCDLSAASGVARRSPTLLRAASERARGTMRELDVSGWYRSVVGESLGDEQLLPVLRSNAASLLELRAWKPVGSSVNTNSTAAAIEQLLVAAPRLRLLECDARLVGEVARGPVPRLLCEPQFAPLRLRNFTIDAWHMQSPPDAPALAAWAATHPSLKSLYLGGYWLDSQPALDAVVGMAATQLCTLTLDNCLLSPASLPALTQMLESRSLWRLVLVNDDVPLLVGAAVPAFCTALRASRRLYVLRLNDMRLWELQADGVAVIAACTGHPTLRQIDFGDNDLNVPGRTAIDAALDALQASIPRLLLIR